MSQSGKDLIRWALLLPGVIIGGFLATFPLHWVLYFTLAHGETISGVNIDSIENALYPLVISFAFILSGSYIAPKHKFKTAIVLIILYFTTFISLFLFIPNSQVKFGVRGVGALAGSVLGLFIAWKKYGPTHVPQNQIP